MNTFNCRVDALVDALASQNTSFIFLPFFLPLTSTSNASFKSRPYDMRTSSLLTLLTFCASVLAVGVPPVGDGCVDPSGLAKCVQAQDKDFVTCGTQCNQTSSSPARRNECLVGCGIWQSAAYIGCEVQSCWNKVSES